MFRIDSGLVLSMTVRRATTAPLIAHVIPRDGIFVAQNFWRQERDLSELFDVVFTVVDGEQNMPPVVTLGDAW